MKTLPILLFLSMTSLVIPMFHFQSQNWIKYLDVNQRSSISTKPKPVKIRRIPLAWFQSINKRKNLPRIPLHIVSHSPIPPQSKC